jgi:hypothetical protein
MREKALLCLSVPIRGDEVRALELESEKCLGATIFELHNIFVHFANERNGTYNADHAGIHFGKRSDGTNAVAIIESSVYQPVVHPDAPI